MAHASFKASAPGSLMLFGEYAVLSGKPALVTAIDQRITVTLTPHDDETITIHSELAEHHTTRTALDSHSKLRFIMIALQQAPFLPSGFHLSVDSTFSSTMGLGSSAAVTVATLQVLNDWLQQEKTPETLWQQAIRVIHAVQGKGSGADIAASIKGGVVLFRNEPLTITRVAEQLPLSVIFSGNKISTTEALKKIEVSENWKTAMSDLTEKAQNALRQKDWVLFGDLLNQGQALMVQLGVSNSTLNQIAQTLCENQGIFGAKISGSGFGDCVIGLGELSDDPTLERLAIRSGLQGVQRH